jgi:hypothetical protein
MLLPMYFLIGIWGGPRREYAAIKFFLYTLAGSVLMLLGIIALTRRGPDDHALQHPGCPDGAHSRSTARPRGGGALFGWPFLK